jgi:2-isopropylmalate synthase
MPEANHSALIYDWNDVEHKFDLKGRKPELDDETLRDGLQSPSVQDPPLASKIKILHLIDKLGIQKADIGLPGAGPHVVETVTVLAKEIAEKKLRVKPSCAARTVAADIRPIIDVSQKVGIPIEVDCFIGSSPIRQYAEDWPLDKMLRHTEEAVTMAVREGLSVMYVTEDTTRAHPDTLKKLYSTAISCGAKAVCLSDTVGHATPAGAKALVKFIRNEVLAPSGEKVKIDWHGHNDRGFAVVNCLAALEAGADRVHGCGIGIGERVGNAAMDQILANLKMLGVWENDLTALHEYCRLISEVTGVPIPDNYPVFGRDAFRTGTGVHAAAIIKAKRKGDTWLADRVYSSMPAAVFGLQQIIEVGPMCGLSNVIYWLESHGYEATEELTQAVFRAAKDSKHVLSDGEVQAVIRKARGE